VTRKIIVILTITSAVLDDNIIIIIIIIVVVIIVIRLNSRYPIIQRIQYHLSDMFDLSLVLSFTPIVIIIIFFIALGTQFPRAKKLRRLL